MRKHTGKAKAKTKTTPRKNGAWFARKVAELKAELEKLPADRQAQLVKNLERGKGDEMNVLSSDDRR